MGGRGMDLPRGARRGTDCERTVDFERVAGMVTVSGELQNEREAGHRLPYPIVLEYNWGANWSILCNI